MKIDKNLSVNLNVFTEGRISCKQSNIKFINLILTFKTIQHKTLEFISIFSIFSISLRQMQYTTLISNIFFKH